MGFLFVLCCFLSLIHHLLHSQQSCVYGDDVKTHSNWHTTSKILLALTSRDRLVVRTLRCGRSNPGSNPGHGILKQFFFLLFFTTGGKKSGLNRDLNPGPLAPKARIIPLDH